MSPTEHILSISQILEKKWEYIDEGLQIFMDMKKAYESVRREVLCNILIQSGFTLEMVRLIKMCLNETCSRFTVGTFLCDLFPIKNG